MSELRRELVEMDENELRFILQEGEGLKIEFKESFDKTIAKEMVAFANASGGKIFLGIDDSGRVVGCALANKLKSQVLDIAKNCDPSIRINISGFDNIAIISVEESGNKPHKCSFGFYLRQGASSVKLSRDQIIDFISEEGRIKFDELVNREFKYPDDFDKVKLDSYLREAQISKLISNKKTLLDLSAAKDNLIFTNAGVLFFAANPQKFVPQSVFTCVLFRDNEGCDIIDRQEIEGSLIQIIENVMKFAGKNTRVAYRFTGKPQRENVYEYPLEAIREAVVNSVMHRDYLESGHNNILRIYPKKLAITNVWTKPSWFKLGRDTFRRNKIIADLFFRVGLIEKIGSGFARMKKYCNDANAPVFNLDIDKKFFRIEFFKSKNYLKLAKTGEKPAKGLGEKL
ncbi:MAG: putative DNA binding domain-containing protein, partial [Candidatus Diapherotrites archaeon]|nr:putative DNA binding domain-containing protein [Candidatus Diapherotrites archaeon]